MTAQYNHEDEPGVALSMMAFDALPAHIRHVLNDDGDTQAVFVRHRSKWSRDDLLAFKTYWKAILYRDGQVGKRPMQEVMIDIAKISAMS